MTSRSIVVALTLPALALPVLMTPACSEYSQDGPAAGAGGTAASGGVAPASGGVQPSGGTTPSGGGVGDGGTTMTGGTGTGDGGVSPGTGGGTTGGGGNPGGGGGDPGGGGGNPGGGGDPGTGGTGGGNSTVAEGPCDIYAAAGQECVAAYSTIRRLSSTYTGPLYQIRTNSNTENTGTGPAEDLHDIPQGPDGFADPSTQLELCPVGTTCTVALLYDQSGKENHLPVAKGGRSEGGMWAALDDFETVMDNRAAVNVGGHDVFSLRMDTRQGYRLTAPGNDVPIGHEPQGIYMLADGTHSGSACCWDFGNVTPDPTMYSEMNTLFFGEAYWGDGAGSAPWFGADFEAGVWMGGSVAGDPGWGELNATTRPPNPNNPSMAGVKFALGFLKTDDDADNTYSLRMANVSTATEVQTAWTGPYPKLSYAGHGTDNKGAIVLGVGGDNSNNSWGTFYEGAVVAGYPDDATELAVMQNIQAAGYSE